MNRRIIEIGFFDKSEIRCFEFETERQSEDLLVAIEGILKKERKGLNDLRGILVNLGPGSFTGVRVGVTVANTLAWSLNIPIFGFREGELEKAILKIKNSKFGNFSKIVLPYYQ